MYGCLYISSYVHRSSFTLYESNACANHRPNTYFSSTLYKRKLSTAYLSLSQLDLPVSQLACLLVSVSHLVCRLVSVSQLVRQSQSLGWSVDCLRGLSVGLSIAVFQLLCLRRSQLVCLRLSVDQSASLSCPSST